MAKLEFPLQFKRQYAAPFDVDALFFTSQDRLNYLADPVCFGGHICVDLETEQAYIVKADKSGFKPIGDVSKEDFDKLKAAFDSHDHKGLYEELANKGKANGYAGLDSGAKLPMSLIPDALIGQVQYQSSYDAAGNIPALSNPPAQETKGHYYVVAKGGTRFGLDFKVGDWIISNGSEWQKVDNTDAVVSVHGRIGAIVANTGDYNSSQITHGAGNVGSYLDSLNINNWNQAYAWGNHAGLYAASVHDHKGTYEPVISKKTGFNLDIGTTAGTLAAGDDSRITNGQTAFEWGNHGSAGYLTRLPDHHHDDAYLKLTGGTLTGTLFSPKLVVGKTLSQYNSGDLEFVKENGTFEQPVKMLFGQYTKWGSRLEIKSTGYHFYGGLVSTESYGNLYAGPMYVKEYSTSEFQKVWHAGNLNPDDIKGSDGTDHNHDTSYLRLDDAKINNWNTAYGWGNHASAGYISSNDSRILNGQTAYNWGNHASANYFSAGGGTLSGDIDLNNNVLKFHHADAANMDHIWHDDATNTYHMVSDGPLKATGNTTLQIGTIKLGTATVNASTVNNWNTAHGWGNHASAGYAAGNHSHSELHGHAVSLGEAATFNQYPLGSRISVEYSTAWGPEASWATAVSFTPGPTRGIQLISPHSSNKLYVRGANGATGTEGFTPWTQIWTDTTLTKLSQLSNDAGFLTSMPSHDHDRTRITDSRGAQRPPSFYDRNYAQWDFQQNTDTGAGGDQWHGLLTVSKWSSFNVAHRQEQLVFTGGDLKHRQATSDTAWGAWRMIWDSGNLNKSNVPFIASDITANGDVITSSLKVRKIATTDNGNAVLRYNASTHQLLIEPWTDENGSKHAPIELMLRHNGDYRKVWHSANLDPSSYLTAGSTGPGSGFIADGADKVEMVTSSGTSSGYYKFYIGQDASSVSGYYASYANGSAKYKLRAGYADDAGSVGGVSLSNLLRSDASGSLNGNLSVTGNITFDGLISQSSANTGMNYIRRTSSSPALYLENHGTGNIISFRAGISQKAYVANDGTMYAPNFAETSDIRRKENLRPIEGASEKLRQLETFYFSWKGPEDDGKEHLGISAQQLNELYPEAVKYDQQEDRYWVTYTALVPVLIAADREKQERLECLERRLSLLEKRAA